MRFFSCLSIPVIVLCLSHCAEQKALLFEARVSQGRVSSLLEEASGIVAASTQMSPGILWAINDSGHDAEVFLLDNHAKIMMTCRLRGVENRDWEALAVHSRRGDHLSFLYIGEIGDNQAAYDEYHIYRFPEPAYQEGATIRIDSLETLTFSLPDRARDMESLVVDPLDGEMYVLSKREEHITMYHLEEQEDSHVLNPYPIASLPYRLTVSADFSPDGSEFLLKTYSEIMYWKRLDGERVEDMVQRLPQRLAYNPEPQGEAIAWNRQGTGFYTLSETKKKRGAHLYFYRRK